MENGTTEAETVSGGRSEDRMGGAGALDESGRRAAEVAGLNGGADAARREESDGGVSSLSRGALSETAHRSPPHPQRSKASTDTCHNGGEETVSNTGAGAPK